MIRSFKHKALKALFETGASAGIRPELQARALRRLDVLDRAVALSDLNIPGLDFHRLQGRPIRYSVHVNGPWCITFEWVDGEAVRVDLEQYH
jgi:proteic killer suppression protein